MGASQLLHEGFLEVKKVRKGIQKAVNTSTLYRSSYWSWQPMRQHFPTTLPGSYLPGRSHFPTESPGPASCSATLRVFDKLSWTLRVVECQFVKYPKCGICLPAPGQGRWHMTNGLPAGYKDAHQAPSSHKLFYVTLQELRHFFLRTPEKKCSISGKYSPGLSLHTP
ncbi:uncharacterized protein LOC112615204 [Theropithecus gelada]|uniref:uncharacterized protein LOC112615204 n=1 Tax=Theropithecus gelada TaxID=9565 RepID=UPI000DC18725|nr:uncharacterized protein LOC112615204 [Theropithecus gelada]